MVTLRNLPYVSNKGRNNGNSNKIKEVIWEWAIKKVSQKNLEDGYLNWELEKLIRNSNTNKYLHSSSNFFYLCFHWQIWSSHSKNHDWFVVPVYFLFSNVASNKQHMTLTFSVDVSPAFYRKNKCSWKHCQIFWSLPKLAESCKYIFKEGGGERKQKCLHFK